MTKQLGELLVELGKIDQPTLDRALVLQEKRGERLADILCMLGMLSESDKVRALSLQLSIPVVGANDFPSDPVLHEKISVKFLKESKIVPVAETDECLTVAMADPLDSYAIKAMEMIAGRPVAVRIATEQDIETQIAKCHEGGRTALEELYDDIGGQIDVADQKDDIARLKDLASEAPVIRLVNLLVNRALEERASDIHIEPFENKLTVRYRVDGVLREKNPPPPRLSAAITSRIKLMAQLNIAERRLAQDGRIRFIHQGREIDIRVSTVPTIHGESLVMRLLDKSALTLELRALGLDEDDESKLRDMLRLPHGIFIVTGPTGSGKSTTLYSGLSLLNTPEKKLITVEEPVEYQLEGVNQIEVKPQIDLTFARILRSVVRQDPDIIMIGEIRDLETAEIAVQSALTGHMVLSTLHTNSAAGALTRLVDMGVDDYLISSTLNGVLGQRLVRLLCPNCREAYSPSADLVTRLSLGRFANGEALRLYQPKGCEQCNDIGYLGRAGIFELLPVTDEIRGLLMKNADANVIHRAAIKGGMRTMYDDGMRKALAGVTTVEEILRVTKITQEAGD
ncbi:MAG: type II secretion system ATPase GspE [Sphingomonadales bacterium]